MNLLNRTALTVRSYSTLISALSLIAAVMAGANGCKWG